MRTLDEELERKAINRYILPVPKDFLERIDRTSSPAHVGNLRNAIDLIVPVNFTRTINYRNY